MLLKNIFFNKLGYLHKLLFNLITNFLEYFIEVQRLFHFELQMSPLHCFPHFPREYFASTTFVLPIYGNIQVCSIPVSRNFTFQTFIRNHPIISTVYGPWLYSHIVKIISVLRNR